jgi:uncharacterized protein (UPF0335 family)
MYLPKRAVKKQLKSITLQIAKLEAELKKLKKKVKDNASGK